MVVDQLVEWALRIPEVRGSNPVIDKNLYLTCKKKRPEMAHLKKLSGERQRFCIFGGLRRPNRDIFLLNAYLLNLRLIHWFVSCILL